MGKTSETISKTSSINEISDLDSKFDTQFRKTQEFINAEIISRKANSVYQTRT